MKREHFNWWITINNPNPDFQDFMEARHKLEELGIHDNDEKIGILLTIQQWDNFKKNISRFEIQMVNDHACAHSVCGFPVTFIPHIIVSR